MQTIRIMSLVLAVIAAIIFMIEGERFTVVAWPIIASLFIAEGIKFRRHKSG